MMRLIVMLATLAVSTGALAAAPEVLNVRAEQRTDGSGLVDVLFDLADADGDSVYVTLAASDDDGATWDLPCRTLSGDAGPGVPAVAGRAAVWDFGTDCPDLEFKTCRVRVTVSDRGVPWDVHDPVPAIHAWERIDWDDEQRLEEMARTDLLVLTGALLWGEPGVEGQDMLQRIRRHNPDIRILAYVLAKNVDIRGENSTHPYFRDRFDRLRPYWCWTTEGDTLQDWDYRVVVNLLEPACRAEVVDIIVDWQRQSTNKFDGVFWDYFADYIMIFDWLTVDGLADLDGDGIGMNSDPDERAAYRDACTWMVEALRDSLGNDFLQIFNGTRAYSDSTFASLADGVNYEYFPDVFFPRTEPLKHALDPDYEWNLFRTASWPRTDNGGPYVLLENLQKNYYYNSTDGLPHELVTGKLLRVVALLTDTKPVFLDGPHHYGWPYTPIRIGEPLGPAVETENGWRRDFEYGDVELTWRNGYMPTPFDYVIRANGRVIEEMNIPYEYPVTPEFPPGYP